MKAEETYYAKRGRKYVPVSYYNSNMGDALKKGCHLVVVMDSVTMYKMGIDPDHAAVLGSLKMCEHDLAQIIVEASKPKLNTTQPLTPKQVKMWRDLEKSIGTPYVMAMPNAYDIIKALQCKLVELIKEKQKGS